MLHNVLEGFLKSDDTLPAAVAWMRVHGSGLSGYDLQHLSPAIPSVEALDAILPYVRPGRRHQLITTGLSPEFIDYWFTQKKSSAVWERLACCENLSAEQVNLILTEGHKKPVAKVIEIHGANLSDDQIYTSAKSLFEKYRAVPNIPLEGGRRGLVEKLFQLYNSTEPQPFKSNDEAHMCRLWNYAALSGIEVSAELGKVLHKPWLLAPSGKVTITQLLKELPENREHARWGYNHHMSYNHYMSGLGHCLDLVGAANIREAILSHPGRAAFLQRASDQNLIRYYIRTSDVAALSAVRDDRLLGQEVLGLMATVCRSRTVPGLDRVPPEVAARLRAETLRAYNPYAGEVAEVVAPYLLEAFGENPDAWSFFYETLADWDESIESLVETTLAAVE